MGEGRFDRGVGMDSGVDEDVLVADMSGDEGVTIGVVQRPIVKSEDLRYGDRVTSVDPMLVDEEVRPPAPDHSSEHDKDRKRTQQGNRRPDEEPAFGQGG